MLALTLIQPWATLIIAHGKDIENRTWATSHRGPLLIHAGKKIDPDGLAFARARGIVLDELPVGGIIGRVELTACTRDSRSPWAMPGRWHWHLAQPEPLPFQPARGHMGLFHIGPKPQQTLGF